MTEINSNYSPRAVLAAIGAKLRSLDLLAPIGEKVKINQKKIKHEPFDKLQDALITILAGAHGLCEINTRLRSDPALQRAFGILINSGPRYSFSCWAAGGFLSDL